VDPAWLIEWKVVAHRKYSALVNREIHKKITGVAKEYRLVDMLMKLQNSALSYWIFKFFWTIVVATAHFKI
jgi:hypothetical protein